MAAALTAPTPTPAPTSKPPTTSSTASLLSDQAQDIPIFLRKTYHMIDTCDGSIACWSEDGETFVVKDPVKFERSIIPQFFKHSKFSSFVRQLNFYAFRKIKYADTIRIDPQLEAETANYWRFRHEKFQRGKPELLVEIKRMNGQKQQQQQKAAAAAAAASAGVAADNKTSNALKSEVTSLKQRIEDMTKNIDQLTSMVQKVTIQQQNQKTQGQQQGTIDPKSSSTDARQDALGNKRKKMDAPSAPLPDQMLSGSTPELALSNSAVTSSSTTTMDIDDMNLLPPSIPSPLPVSGKRETSNTSELSDDGFVDQLFTAFKTEDFDFDMDDSISSSSANKNTVKNEKDAQKDNRPRPELMDKLSDALSTLPRDIQEMIVDRLIQAITSPKEIQENISAASCLQNVKVNATPGGKAVLPEPVPQSPILESCGADDADDHRPQHQSPSQSEVGLPLAAATLAALLSQYGQVPKESNKQQQAHKTIPVIPVHA